MTPVRVALWFFLLCAATAGGAAETAAIVNRIDGNATVTRAAKPARLAVLDELGRASCRERV